MFLKVQTSFLILLIYFSIVNSLKYITIPFQVKKFDYKEDKNGLLHEYLYKDILVNVSFGTPKQTIPLLAGMGEYSTYIVSKEATDLEGAIFDKDLSTSYFTNLEINEIYSYQTFSHAFPSRETFHLDYPEIQVEDYEFFLVTKVGKNICYLPYCEILTQPGVIGFRMAQSETYSEKVNNTNLIMQLKNKEVIDNYDFSFYFESPEKGAIIIGQKPHEYDKSHYKQENFKFTKVTIENTKELDWGLHFNKIFFGKEEIASDKTMLLRVEFGLINGNKKWQEALEKNFFGELMKQNICFKGKGWNDGHSYFHYYCNKGTDLSSFKSFNFVIDDLNYNLTLTSDDLFVEDGDKLLFLIIFGHPQAILGYPVFKKYQFIFNQDTRTVGLYSKIDGTPSIPTSLDASKFPSTKKEQPGSYRLIIILLFFVIFILCMYLLINYFRGQKKREMRKILNIQNNNSEIQLVDYEKFDK